MFFCAKKKLRITNLTYAALSNGDKLFKDELAEATAELGDVQLTANPDRRLCCFEDDSHNIPTGHAYRASVGTGAGVRRHP